MKNVGFFGGCFNSPTIAHIDLIEQAIQEYNLDKVYFLRQYIKDYKINSDLKEAIYSKKFIK